MSQVNFVYLHGFASGPGSTKAQYFLQRFQELGIELHIPDLNQPSFTDITLTSRIELIRDAIENLPPLPAIIWGSSLGGLLAVLYAKEHQSKVAGLVLLAPALEFASRWEDMIGKDGLRQWASSGYISVQHYAYKKEELLAYNFFVDAAKHETKNLAIEIPTIIFHGSNDETVPVGVSESFSKLNAQYVQLKKLADGHELIESLPAIWADAKLFMRDWLN